MPRLLYADLIIKGRHLIAGMPKAITITDEEIRDALAATVNVIVDAVRMALERTPPELSADIVDRGIVLTGGGSLLKNTARGTRLAPFQGCDRPGLWHDQRAIIGHSPRRGHARVCGGVRLGSDDIGCLEKLRS